MSYLVESENLRRKQQELQQDNNNTNNLNKDIDSTTNRLTDNNNDFNSTSNNKKGRKSKKTLKKNQNKTRNNSASDLNEDKKLNRIKKHKSDQSFDNSLSAKNNRNSSSFNNNNNGYSININEQKLTKNALFHSPTSILTKLDLKTLFQPSVFESLPRHFQLKVIKLLPECDRQVDSTGSFK